MNIISGRGANFVKAFAVYNPVYCFGHRLNNILKIFFFQQQTKDQSNEATTDNNPKIIKNTRNAGADSTTRQEFTSSDNELDSSDLEENQGLNVLNEDTLVTFQKKRKTTITTTAQVSVADILPEAKKVVLLLKRTKNLVKYVKLVSIQIHIRMSSSFLNSSFFPRSD